MLKCQSQHLVTKVIFFGNPTNAPFLEQITQRFRRLASSLTHLWYKSDVCNLFKWSSTIARFGRVSLYHTCGTPIYFFERIFIFHLIFNKAKVRKYFGGESFTKRPMLVSHPTSSSKISTTIPSVASFSWCQKCAKNRKSCCRWFRIPAFTCWCW